MQQAEEIKLGTIEFSGKDIATPGVKFDRIAVSNRKDELLFVSLIAETQRVKQIRSILSGGAKALIQAAGVKLKLPREPHAYGMAIGRLWQTADGYTEAKHKLGFGQAHAMFFTKMPGFLKVVTPESLWQELNSDRFTTPLLREWMPYIEQQLRVRELLEDAWCYRCRCGVLAATTTHLDEIVSEGLRIGSISISKP